jgi:phage gp37-like protein
MTVSHDEIMDGMVTALASLTTDPGEPLTSTAYVHKIGRFAGRLDTTDEAFQRGVAGRTPAVLVGYEGERTKYNTIGRRTSRVEGDFVAVCVLDAARARDDRKAIYSVVEDVRRLLSARRLSLEISPLRYSGDSTVRDDERMLAIAARFTTRYRVDVTKTNVDYDDMTEASGEIWDAAVSDEDNPTVRVEMFTDLTDSEVDE